MITFINTHGKAFTMCSHGVMTGENASSPLPVFPSRRRTSTRRAHMTPQLTPSSFFGDLTLPKLEEDTQPHSSRP